MQIRNVVHGRQAFLPLLLMGDEQPELVAQYLETGDLYVLEDDGVQGVCVVTDAGGGVLELRNIAVRPAARGRGYGRAMIEFLARRYRGRYTALLAGTGDSPLTVPFYKACGFVFSHRIAGYFPAHYDHPIVEGGVTLVDLVYFRRPL